MSTTLAALQVTQILTGKWRISGICGLGTAAMLCAGCSLCGAENAHEGISTQTRRRIGERRGGQTRRKRVLCAVCQFIDLSDDVPVQITHLTFKLHDIASSNVVIGLLFWERMGGDDRQSCRNESIAANVYLFCQMMMGA